MGLVPTGAHVCFPTWGLCIVVLGEGNPSSLVLGTPRQTPQECKIQHPQPKKKKIPQRLEFFCYFLAMRSYDTMTKQRRPSDSVQDADLLSLHLRMHIGREERAAGRQNVGQRTMTSLLRACDLRLHNSAPLPAALHYHHLFQRHQHQRRQGGRKQPGHAPPPTSSLSLSVWGGHRQARAQI